MAELFLSTMAEDTSGLVRKIRFAVKLSISQSVIPVHNYWQHKTEMVPLEDTLGELGRSRHERANSNFNKNSTLMTSLPPS